MTADSAVQYPGGATPEPKPRPEPKPEPNLRFELEPGFELEHRSGRRPQAFDGSAGPPASKEKMQQQRARLSTPYGLIAIWVCFLACDAKASEHIPVLPSVSSRSALARDATSGLGHSG